MLPPSPMLAQINSARGTIYVLALALLLSGCTPAGPRALLKGKKYLDRGDVASAVTELRRATTLMATNAAAWNYYGVALQLAGQPDDAANAYQTALRLDHELVEAHFNLGALALEQSKPDVAKAELTTYTLRRPNDAAGWLKLGFAQLKTGETMAAERSFSTVLSLKAYEAEAYNGLGLASIQLGKPRDAAQFFAAAVQLRPDFAPALLNLATVNQQYLHDNRTALANFQAYLALTPRPANYDEVKAIVASLTQNEAPVTREVPVTPTAPPVVTRPSPPPPETKPKANVVAVPPPRPAPSNHTVQAETRTSHVPQRTTAPTLAPTPVSSPAVPPPTAPVPNQVVQVPPEPVIVTSPRTNPTSHPTTVARQTAPTNAIASTEPVELPAPEEESKPGFWHRMFNKKNSDVTKHYDENGVTTIPEAHEELAGTKPEEKPTESKPAAEPVPPVARYHYLSPGKPAAGDRQAAEGAFTKARVAEQDENWADAVQWYQTAADADPSWFEAQYNTGVIAHRLHNYSIALRRYELALAIQPDSLDARYNFALALKASGYPADAAQELKKIVAANPNEVRAQLALANIYAQSLHDVPRAREHYLKVLELQPNNPQAADIRFWLQANAK
jgi:tetratricopeptide (TPR) repeat protein